jgi:hypothetical protein
MIAAELTRVLLNRTRDMEPTLVLLPIDTPVEPGTRHIEIDDGIAHSRLCWNYASTGSMIFSFQVLISHQSDAPPQRVAVSFEITQEDLDSLDLDRLSERYLLPWVDRGCAQMEQMEQVERQRDEAILARIIAEERLEKVMGWHFKDSR